MCGIFLGVIEGVGIGFQRLMADQTRLDVSEVLLLLWNLLTFDFQLPPPPSPTEASGMI